MKKETPALNSDNLISLGYYEDFWKLYGEIISIYKETQREYTAKNSDSTQISPWTWQKISNKKVRDLCEPFLNKYSFLFCDKPCTLHANAYGFESFSILSFTFENFEYNYSFISFSDFLVVLLNSVTRIISRWRNRDNPAEAYPKVEEEISSRIQLLVDTDNQSPITNEDLQIDAPQEINHYILFRQWLVDTGNISQCPDAVSFAFSINKFLQKRICSQDLWEIILKKRYSLLYKCRRHPEYQRRSHFAAVREQVLRLCFEYLDRSFDAYIEYEAERVISECSKPNILYLHQGNIACLRYHHPTNDILASIAVGSERPVRVHATHCWKCNIAFMNKSYYLQLRKRYPFLVANFCEISSDGYTPVTTNRFAAESPLKLCGYSARKNSPLSDTERHQILCDIVENGILTKAEILQYLNHFISFNGSKEENAQAVCKWESDYHYVANINIEDHPTVNITEIRPYSQKRSNIDPEK